MALRKAHSVHTFSWDTLDTGELVNPVLLSLGCNQAPQGPRKSLIANQIGVYTAG